MHGRGQPGHGARALLAALAVASASCAHASPRAVDGAMRWRYHVRVPEALDRLEVELCFADGAPRRLILGDEEAAAATVDVRAVSGAATAALDREAATIVLGRAGPDACVAYAVAIEAALELGGSRQTARLGGAVSLDPQLWMWRPATLYEEIEVEVEFAPDPGVSVSVPWEPRGEQRYRAPFTTFTWSSQAVFGAFPKQVVEAAGARFDVAVIDLPRRLSEAGISRWLTTAAETVATLYGRFPAARMQVVVVPFPGGGGPVYFGMATRGGGPAALLLVASDAPDHAFPGEWVAIHEFLHHGMPFIRQADAWLSEGFVTYYTEVLPTRRGFRSERAGWQALHDGFTRGRQDGGGQTLAEASRDMHERRSYQRVYWSGAALALLADLALRSAGKGSLDAAMRHLQRCCAGASRMWPASEVLRELDAWVGKPLFVELAAAWLPSDAFPSVESVYGKLGLDVIKGELTLDENASDAATRRAIFARPP